MVYSSIFLFLIFLCCYCWWSLLSSLHVFLLTTSTFWLQFTTTCIGTLAAELHQMDVNFDVINFSIYIYQTTCKTLRIYIQCEFIYSVKDDHKNFKTELVRNVKAIMIKASKLKIDNKHFDIYFKKKGYINLNIDFHFILTLHYIVCFDKRNKEPRIRRTEYKII